MQTLRLSPSNMTYNRSYRLGMPSFAGLGHLPIAVTVYTRWCCISIRYQAYVIGVSLLCSAFMDATTHNHVYLAWRICFAAVRFLVPGPGMQRL